MANTTAEHDRE